MAALRLRCKPERCREGRDVLHRLRRADPIRKRQLLCLRRAAIAVAICPSRRRTRRRFATRLIAALPVVALVAAVALAVVVARAEQRDAAALYQRASNAERDGRLVEAGRLFIAAGDYADAERRAAAIDERLAPYDATYADAVLAMSDGDFALAVSLFSQLIADVPDYNNAPDLLAQARTGWKSDLLRSARNAEARLNWMTAEQTYAEIALAFPDDQEVAAKLLSIRQERAVYVFTLRQRLSLANPINVEPVEVASEIKASWPVWNPDRTKIAFVSPGDQQNGYVRALYVVDADGSNLRKLAEDPARWRPVFWSPDGARIAFEVDGASVGDPTVRATVKIVELATGVVTDIIGDAFPNGSSPAWSPTGDRLAFIVRGIDILQSNPDVPAEILRVDVSTIYVMTMATGEIAPLGQGVVPEPWRLAWSPVADELLVFSRKDGSSFRKGAIYRLNAATGDALPIARSAFDIMPPVWSPDGRRFAFTIDKETIVIVSADGSQVELTSPIPLEGWLTWSPSADRLLAIGDSGQTYSVLVKLDGQSPEVAAFELFFDSEGGDAGPPQRSATNPASPNAPPMAQ